MAASAGESVSALNAEIAIANAIVSENCLYRMPVVPGKKLTGTNTEISTSDVAMTALVTSRIATLVASCASVIPFRNVPLHVLDHDDRVVHHQPRRQRNAEQRQRIDREPKDLDERGMFQPATPGSSPPE